MREAGLKVIQITIITQYGFFHVCLGRKLEKEIIFFFCPNDHILYKTNVRKWKGSGSGSGCPLNSWILLLSHVTLKLLVAEDVYWGERNGSLTGLLLGLQLCWEMEFEVWCIIEHGLIAGKVRSTIKTLGCRSQLKCSALLCSTSWNWALKSDIFKFLPESPVFLLQAWIFWRGRKWVAAVQSSSFECRSSGMHWDSTGIWGRDSVKIGDACRTVC